MTNRKKSFVALGGLYFNRDRIDNRKEHGGEEEDEAFLLVVLCKPWEINRGTALFNDRATLWRTLWRQRAPCSSAFAYIVSAFVLARFF